MEYTCEILIDKPIDEVIRIFDNFSDNLEKWIDGIVSMESLEGKQGELGSRTKMKFNMNNREMEMVETVLEKDLPRMVKYGYEAKGVYNTVEQRFEKTSESQTKLITISDFKFKGFMKLIAMLMPGAFKKQTRKYQESFKKLVETP